MEIILAKHISKNIISILFRVFALDLRVYLILRKS